jgi:hypothetical protein
VWKKEKHEEFACREPPPKREERLGVVMVFDFGEGWEIFF